MARSLIAIALAAVALVTAQNPEDGVIKPGVAWYDTDGNRMYVGGANMYLENGKYYIIGEGQKVHSDCSECFNLYSTTDFDNWKFEGCMLKNEDIIAPPPYSNEPYYRMERPKIMKCPSTGKYVMWFHCDTSGFAMKSVGVLTADAVTGPYTFASPCFKPDGQDSYDMGTYLDLDQTHPNGAPGGDNKGYLIRSVMNQFAGISQMTDDCLNVTGIVSQGPDMEGQAIMRDQNGTLHAAGSHLTGWSANAAQFVTSANKSLVNAVWQNNYNPSGNPTTYNSQSTFIFPFKHDDGHFTYIWMADRWNANGPGGLDNMTLIWLPMIPPSGAAPTNATVGWILSLNNCDQSDVNQQFMVTQDDTVVHVSSGLCVAQPVGSNAGSNLVLAACNKDDPMQSWMAASFKNTIANTTSGTGNNCVNWNNANNVITAGNQILGYACGSNPAWNAQWSVPAAGQTSVIQALNNNFKPSGMCASVGPASNPSQWTLPWYDSWSLKDF